MISKLRKNFILLSMVALLTLLVVVVVGMNLINYNTVVKEADTILSMISNNGGRFPEFNGEKNEFMGRPMSPEIPFESRFFSVLYNTEGEVVFTDVGQIAAIDRESAISYGKKALNSKKTLGFLGGFRFAKNQDIKGVRIIFLDCGRRLSAFNSFLITSLLVAGLGYIIITVFIVFVSDRILKPVAEAYEKQKRFITDAGHEIKTPLTIIGANVDLLEMEMGENENLKDIEKQTKRLAGLTSDLVYLSRMEEAENLVNIIDFPFSDLTAETANSFSSLAKAQEKNIAINVEPMLSMKGDPKAMEKLISILLSNAIKYSPKDSTITLSLTSKGKQLILSVENTTVQKINRENIENVFDRFYRCDESRNSQTGGHGIGLSIAKAIVNAHGGKIKAFSFNDYSFGVVVEFGKN